MELSRFRYGSEAQRFLYAVCRGFSPLVGAKLGRIFELRSIVGDFFSFSANIELFLTVHLFNGAKLGKIFCSHKHFEK